MIGSMQLDSVIMNYARYTEQKTSSKGQVNSFSGVYESKSAASVDAARTEETAGTEKVSLESMLKAKYPNLVYNVGDATSSDWRTRNDYPFEALFQEGEKSTELIENWKPTGANPKNQRHLAIPPNSKAVMIHPKAQERMENDPEFAKEVMERIESWWAYDIARNEAISPGCTTGMSQAIAIGEDGEIANVLAGGGSDTMRSNKQKNNNDEDEYDWWTERMARHALYMQLWLEGKSDINLSSFSFMGGGSFGSSGFSSMNSMLAMQSGQSAEREIHSMLQNGLKEKVGDTICGMPTDEVIDGTWADIEKGRSMRMSLMMM
ncbi:MAG: hypothetical protein IKY94_10235 [Lachnospiraceae bacterium]|nr:hypothetical protein [Lachnospiraceae bacterium]